MGSSPAPAGELRRSRGRAAAAHLSQKIARQANDNDLLDVAKHHLPRPAIFSRGEAIFDVSELLALIERRDAAVSELADHLAAAELSFHTAIELGEAIAAGWPFSATDQQIALCSAFKFSRAVAHEIYRIGVRPFIGGDPLRKAEVSFPAPRCDDLKLRGNLGAQALLLRAGCALGQVH